MRSIICSPSARLVALAHASLDRGGAGDGVDHAVEHGERAVADQLDQLAVVPRQQRLDDFGPRRRHPRDRPGLVGLHLPRVADHVGRHDRQHAAVERGSLLHAIVSHGRSIAGSIGEASSPVARRNRLCSVPAGEDGAGWRAERFGDERWRATWRARGPAAAAGGAARRGAAAGPRGPGGRALQAAERGRHHRPSTRAPSTCSSGWVWRRPCRPASRPAPRAAPTSTSMAGSASRGAGRGCHRRCRPPLPAVRPGPAPRPRAVGQQGPFRHGRRGRAHGRPEDPRVPRVAAAGPLRRRAHRRLAGPHPLLPAHPGAARHGRRHGARPQHALRLHRRHHQACRHELLPRRHAECRA